MDSRLIRRVVVLARMLSYTKAAEQLGISQSVLTRSIQDVERNAKVRLFDRNRSGVHLTPVGRAFVERAAAVLHDADDLDRLLQRASGGAEGKVCFGVEQLHASALAPAVLQDELRADGGLEVFVAVRRAGALLPLLVSEEIEFFICTEGAFPMDAPVKSTPLGEFPLSLLVRRDHPLITDGPEAWRKTFPIVAGNYFPTSAAFPAFFWRYLTSAPQMVIEDSECLSHLTQTSDAIWVSSPFTVAAAVAEGRLVEIEPPAGEPAGRLRTAFYSLDRRSISPAALRLQSRIRARLAGLWRCQQGAPADGFEPGAAPLV
jgi:DNA-binding transcriptional LysR family regulator